MTPFARFLIYLRVVSRQLLRNRRRASLTFVGVVISFFLYTSIGALLGTLGVTLDRSASAMVLVLRARNEVGLFRAELPRSYAARVLDIDGISSASPLRFHVGVGRSDDNTAITFGIEPESFYATHRPPTLTRADLAGLERERGAALVGRAVLEQNGWAIDDRVTVRGFGESRPLSLHIVGAIDGDERLTGVLLVNIEYLEDVLGEAGKVSFIEVRVERAEFAGPLARAIDERFANFSVPTETTTERTEMGTVLSGLSAAFGALRAIGYLGLAVTALVVGNSISMSIRERTVEIATLRALGFGKRWVAQMVLGESVLLSFLGGLTGTLLAVGGAAACNAGWIKPLGAVQVAVLIPPRVFAEVALLSVPVGILAALPTLWSALRMPIARALRSAL